ncbi:tetratricopeptide repeat protein [Asticcacaulis excentricus]|uniref:Sel1 domain protein repeat-containing protein n=1 Tax=Asticcacaulis excentricus (strain ATCC 15261 / DSM 4724 / KCTC 12464 / NCIMB 9791 / VKM B-1370 / CB 48) TaxID=573065 RepID=E8RT87_ASTEC|nr:tetratricopeptide repeat protein [Asticcacaulis excentricus]ADU14708.1 Sel1 domain protein repeat-containing protein [Asticcacaulis excentricus CB 48]
MTNLTDIRNPKPKPWVRVVQVLAFVVPLIIAGLWMWQENERWRGVKIYKTAFDYELAYAEIGVLKSQVYVAQAYDNGFQVEKDPAKAVEWYKKAAAQSHAEAQYQLGRHYLSGEGIAKDEKEAFVWVQRSAFKDYPQGLLLTGQMLCEGRGVEANCARGIDLIRKAAEAGLPEAQTEWARRLETGEGVAKDLTEAYVYHALAHEARTWQQSPAPVSADLQRLTSLMTRAQLAEAEKRFTERRPERVRPGQNQVTF